MAVVLFADVVGSTDLQSRLGDSRYDDVRRSLMQSLARVVDENDGTVVKTMGDGLMATFGSAITALVAADGLLGVTDQEHRSWGLPRPVELRIGVAAGDVILDGADVHGTAVVEAARLCGAAAAGQVLCSEVVAALARGSEDRIELVPVGELSLKGLPRPVPAVELRAVQPVPSSLPLPAALAPVGPFVGRTDEVEALRAAARPPVAERGARARRLLLVSGEPGIGKTRLVAEAAAAAHAGGAAVVLGRCVEDLVAPFAPWTEIITTLGEHLSDDELTAHGERHGAVLERLVPALRSRLAGMSPPEPVEPGVERLRLADAIDDLLATAARNHPLVVVLDDLHWADEASIAVLGHVLRSSRPGTMALLGTYRDTDLDRSHPFAASLADLHRTGTVERHALTGLDHRGVSELVGALADQEADPALVDALVAETNGNPFFVSEVLRHLAESGAYRRVDGRWVAERPLEDLGLPQGVREVVGRRLSRLDDPVNRLLATAAVMGAEFTADVLEAALGVDAEEVDDSLAVAVRTGLVREVDRRAGRFAFAHALIRQLLLEELPGARRARLHWAIGAATRRRHPRALESIAFHFTEGVLAGSPEEAVDAATEAGEAAIGRSVGAQAQLFFERALATIDVCELEDAERRYRALDGMGRASVLRLDTEGWTSSFVAAALLAREQGWSARFVDSVIAATQLGDIGGVIDPRVEALLAEARSLAGDGRQLAGLLCGSSAAAYGRGDFGEAASQARAALDVARQTGDLDTIAQAQWTVCTYRFGLDPPEVVAADLRALEAAVERRAGDQYGSMYGSLTQVLEGLRCLAALQRGDRAEVEGYLAAAAELPGMNRRFNVPYWAATLANLDGRLDDQMALADELVARFPDYAISHVCHLSQLLDVTLEREGWGAAKPIADRTSELMGAAAATFEASRAAMMARHGELEDAEGAVRRGLGLLADGDGGSNRPLTAAGIAEAAWAMRRPEWAEAVLDELQPHLGAMITYSFGWRVFPADLPWGFALLALGDRDGAVGHMERAVSAAERFDAPALALRCRLALVQALRARAGAGDHDRAVDELEAATAGASSLGLVETLAHCRALAAPGATSGGSV